MATTGVSQLDVFEGDVHVGTIHDTEPISFAYAQGWLNFTGHYPIAGLELKPGRNTSPAAKAYFENLLPEAALRDVLALQAKASSVFALLKAVAGDNVGPLVILPAGERPQPPRYELTSWESITKAFAGQGLEGELGRLGHRISVSGAQRKFSVSLNEQGLPLWPLGTSASTYIVKPDIKLLDGVWCSAANETVVMRAAKHCGLDVAEVFYEPISKSCVVQRFDRALDADRVVRRVQYDFCQLSATLSDKKYEHEGGPGFKSCVDVIKKNSTRPAADLKRIVQWLFFNLMVGNNDSHAKNLSLYQLPGEGVRLSPHYDLMCTRIYPGLSKDFAFRVGGKTLPGQIGQAQIVALATEIGTKPSYLRDIAGTIHKNLLPSINRAIDELAPTFGPSEKTLAERLEKKVTAIANSFKEKLG